MFMFVGVHTNVERKRIVLIFPFLLRFHFAFLSFFPTSFLSTIILLHIGRTGN